MEDLGGRGDGAFLGMKEGRGKGKAGAPSRDCW